jgi:hypothetical protein
MSLSAHWHTYLFLTHIISRPIIHTTMCCVSFALASQRSLPCMHSESWSSCFVLASDISPHLTSRYLHNFVLQFCSFVYVHFFVSHHTRQAEAFSMIAAILTPCLLDCVLHPFHVILLFRGGSAPCTYYLLCIQRHMEYVK